MIKDDNKLMFESSKNSTEKLLKSSRQEIGELKSYIDELQYDVKNLKKEIYKLRSENTKLRNLCKKLKYYEIRFNKIRKKYKLLLQSFSLKKNE